MDFARPMSNGKWRAKQVKMELQQADARSDSGINVSLRGFPPGQNEFALKLSRFAPRQNEFAPERSRFAPEQNEFAMGRRRFAPGRNRSDSWVKRQQMAVLLGFLPQKPANARYYATQTS
jgi:hypothetical protein